MSSILKFLKTIRNHWKKSTFAACAITYTANYAKESYEIQTLMEKYCSIARMYGMHQLQPSENPRKVLIILNPTANRRKAVKQFEQYCLPILHLAGICVDVIQTKSEGHARSIIQEHKDKTDAIVIAGGDGTLCESVTGLMRRDDNYVMLDACPLGVLPLGRQNTFARSLFQDDGGKGSLEEVRRLADASMAVVTERTKRADVLKIETNAPVISPNHTTANFPDDTTLTLDRTTPQPPGVPTGASDITADAFDTIDNTTTAPKPVFALSGVEWGSYRDAHAKIEKYWYFGRLRKYAAYIFNGYKSNLSWNCAGDISYFPPCSGCSNCYKELQTPEVITHQQQNTGRWWSSFVQKNPPGAAPATQPVPKQLELVVNENCAKSTTKSISTADFHLTINRDAPELVLNLGPPSPEITYWNFVAEGCAAENGGKRTVRESINARQIYVRPDQGNSQFYSIDNEEFEVKPIRVTLLPKLIQFFV